MADEVTEPQVEEQPVETAVAEESVAPAPTPEARPSILDYAKEKGVELQHASDMEAYDALLDAYRSKGQFEQQRQQDSQLLYYGQEYLRHAPEFTAWQKAQQEAQQQAKQPKEEPLWPEAPITHEEYLRLREEAYKFDPATGQPVPQPGPALEKAKQYEQHVKNWTHQVLYNPQKALEPVIEKRAKSIAEEAIRQEMQRYQSQQQAQQFFSQHSHWMVARDPQTQQPVYGHNGQVQYTPEGARFGQYVGSLNQLGVNDVAQANGLALALLELEVRRSQDQKAQGDKGKEKFVQQHNRLTDVKTRNGKESAKAPRKLRLIEMLNNDLKDFSDEDMDRMVAAK